jgi:hypothetical protein
MNDSGSEGETGRPKNRRYGDQRRGSQQQAPQSRTTQKKNKPKEVDWADITDALDSLLSNSNSTADFDTFLSDPKWLAAFTPKSRLRGQIHRMDAGNIFHHLVRGTTRWPKDKIECLLKWLLQGKRPIETSNGDPTTSDTTTSLASKNTPRPPFLDLLEEPASDNTTPIHRALSTSFQNKTFVGAMLSLDPLPDNLGKILCMPKAENDYTNCLHVAISARSEYIGRIIAVIKSQCQNKELASALNARDLNGNTPLHAAVNKMSTSGLSRLWRHLQPKTLKSLSEHYDISQPNGNESDQPVSRDLGVVEELILSNTATLTIQNNKKRTPYQERIFCLEQRWKKMESKADKIDNPGDNHGDSQGDSSDDSSGDSSGDESHDSESEPHQVIGRHETFQNFVLCDPVASFISYYCIKHLDRKDAIPCLYQTGKGMYTRSPGGESQLLTFIFVNAELAIDFNLEGLSHSSITDSYLHRLETHLRFERTLKWVALPRLTIPKANDSGKRVKGHVVP